MRRRAVPARKLRFRDHRRGRSLCPPPAAWLPRRRARRYVGVKFWSNSEANRLPAELVSDRAFMGIGMFRSHWSFRLQDSKLFN